jgi:hypothetical protein
MRKNRGYVFSVEQSRNWKKKKIKIKKKIKRKK